MKKIILLSLAIILFWIGISFSAIRIGASRWDCMNSNQNWCGYTYYESGGSLQMGEIGDLGPLIWHYRVPTFLTIYSATMPIAAVGNESAVRGNENVQEIIDQEILYAVAGGIDHWIYTTDLNPTTNTYMNYALAKHMTSPYKDQLGFCISLLGGSYDAADWVSVRRVNLINMFKDSMYVKVGTRPVLYIWNISSMITALGGTANTQAWFTSLREYSQAEGAGNPYIVAMSTSTSTASSWVTTYGLDAISAYAYPNDSSLSGITGPEYQGIALTGRAKWDLAKATGKKVIPSVTYGYAAGPRNDFAGSDYPTPYEGAMHLKSAMDWCTANPTVCDSEIVQIYSWNEYCEGGWLHPTYSEGTARLDAIAAMKAGTLAETVSINNNTTGTGNNQFEYVGTWTRSYSSSNLTTSRWQRDEHKSSTAGSYFTLRFNGGRVLLYGAKSPTSGTATVTIDGTTVSTINNYQAIRNENMLLFDSGVITKGQHTLIVQVVSGTIYVDRVDVTQEEAEPPVPPETNRVLPVSTTNPRYFEDEGGNVVLFTGAHTWNNLVDMDTSYPPSEFDWNGYLTYLKSYNMNLIRLWSWHLPKWSCGSTVKYLEPMPWARSSTTGATDGRNKFDLTDWNEEYFTRLASRVATAKAQGIYVSIVLFEGYGPQFCRRDYTSPNGDGYPFSSTNNINSISDSFVYDSNGTKSGTESITRTDAAIEAIQIAYMKKVVDAVNAYDNVMYEIANEAGYMSEAWQNNMISELNTYQATKANQHPVGKTWQYSKGSYTQAQAEAWLTGSSADFISPGGEVTLNWITAPPVADGSKVSIIDTDHFGGGASVPGTWVWKAFTRGHHILSMESAINDTDPEVTAQRTQQKNLRVYTSKIGLVNMTPSSTLSSTGYCLANPGTEYLVYQPTNGSFTLTLTAKRYYYEWFDPTDSAIESTGYITTTGTSQSFTQPSTIEGDAVLYLKAEEASAGGTCSNEDVQNAVNAAARGSTVTVPKGSCTWTAPVIIPKAITLIGEGNNKNDCTNSTCITSGFKSDASVAITSITRSGTVATVTQVAHGMNTDDHIYIKGADQTEYNGEKTIVRLTDNTYTYTVTGSPATPATGTITSGFPKGTNLISVNLSEEDIPYLSRVSNMYMDGANWAGIYSNIYPENVTLWPNKIRVDHLYLERMARARGWGTSGAFIIGGWLDGVVDSNTIDSRGVFEVTKNQRWGGTWKACPVGVTDTKCDSNSALIPWDEGTSASVFYEDNKYIYDSYSQMIVAGAGGSYVVRHNEFDYSLAPGSFYAMDTHGHQRDYVYASFGGEVYGNLIKGNPGVSLQSASLGSFRGNKHKIFGNKYLGNNAYCGIGIHSLYPVTFLTPTTPDGMDGFLWDCPTGSLYDDEEACSYDGRNQNPSHSYIWNNRNDRKNYGGTYDLMTVTTGRGGPCRSPTSTYCTTGSPDLTTCFPPVGTCSNFPSPLDYDVRWLRTDQDAACVDPDESACEAPNYEFWFDAAGWNKYYNITTARGWMQNGASNFDGTKGIGCGTLANRPATCTEGVGYWVPTDILKHPCESVPLGTYGINPPNPIDGVLHICGANNWTDATTYSPYPYPHPLRSDNLDTTAPSYVAGTISPLPTPTVDCTPPSAVVPLTFKVQETQTGPVTCIGCTEGTDGCTSTSTYDQINDMASKITFTSVQTSSIYTQTANKTSLCSNNFNVYASCADSASPANKMSSSIKISYTTDTVETDAPYLVGVTLSPDGRLFVFEFNEEVVVDTSTDSGDSITILFDGGAGSYGLDYSSGSGTKYLYYRIANCIASSIVVTIQIPADLIEDLVGNKFPAQASAVTVTNNSTQTCGATISLFNQVDTPSYTLYTQTNSLPAIRGVRFKEATTIARLTKVCFYKDASMDGETHTALVFGLSEGNPNALLAQKVFASETSSGWQCQTLDTAIDITPGSYYTAAVIFPTKWLRTSDSYFSTAFVGGGALSVPPTNGRWVDSTSIVYPNNATYSNYWVDFNLSYQTASGPWAVTMTKTGVGCSVTPSDTQIVSDTESASATVTLNAGWSATWSDTCGGGSALGTTYTVTSVTEDCGISLTCSKMVKPPWIYVAP